MDRKTSGWPSGRNSGRKTPPPPYSPRSDEEVGKLKYTYDIEGQKDGRLRDRDTVMGTFEQTVRQFVSRASQRAKKVMHSPNTARNDSEKSNSSKMG